MSKHIWDDISSCIMSTNVDLCKEKKREDILGFNLLSAHLRSLFKILSLKMQNINPIFNFMLRIATPEKNHIKATTLIFTLM